MADMKKVGKMSHAKGGRAERQLCQIFGAAIFNDVHSFARYRDESNGMMSGDFGPFFKDNIPLTLEIIQKFPFCFEAKNREEWSFHKLLTKNCHIYEYWEQAKDQAYRARKIPFLCFTQNRKPWYGVLPVQETKNYVFPEIFLLHNSQEFIIFNLEDFLKLNSDKFNTLRDIKKQHERE